MNEIKGLKTIAVLELLTGVGLILFWIGFFTIGLAPENPPPCYFVYEHSFPLPDIVMAMAILISGMLLLKKRDREEFLLWSAPAALCSWGFLISASIFRTAPI